MSWTAIASLSTYFSTDQPFIYLRFCSRCNFSSRNTPVIESSRPIAWHPSVPSPRPFLSPLTTFQRYVSTLLRRFSLVCTKSVCLDTTSENLEDRNCSDVTEIFFFQQSTKIDTLLYRNFFSIIETKLRSNNHFRSFLEEWRFLFSNLEKTLENCSDYLR